MCAEASKDWFASWFDSPYYHALYQNRDEDEAGRFISRLVDTLDLPAQGHVLDLACGKGRHSRYLASLGFDVMGVDLSPESIQYANQTSHAHLRFQVADMRTFELEKSFDGIFNLFTSFGYFDNEQDNLKVLCQVKKHLRSGGFFVLDYFNALGICPSSFGPQEKDACGYHFKWEKHVEGGRIFKDIEVTDQGKKFSFQEQVQLLNATMLHSLLEQAGLRVVASYGNYQLNPYDPGTSDRLILVAQHA